VAVAGIAADLQVAPTMTRILVAALIVACASAEADAPAVPWKFVGYAGFVESIDALVGKGAADCGLMDFVNEEISAARKNSSVKCVQDALRGSHAFKFGTLLPNSNVVYILLRSSAGEYWTVRYERYIADGHLHETQINQTCKQMAFDPGPMIYQGVDCKLVSAGGLPTHDSNSRH
jgi:hypothetical protein